MKLLRYILWKNEPAIYDEKDWLMNGNMLSKVTDTSQVRYYWDDEDKMVRLEDSVVMNFKTDGLGFRRMKEVVGRGQTWFVYDLALSETPGLAPLVAEYDENGNLVAKYHHDGGGLIAMPRNNQSYWYGFEAIGTVRQLMDGQGQISDAYAFDAWGNELTSPQSQVPNPFRYVGKHGYYLDIETALMLLGVRYYAAEISRFMSLDPIQSGRNWYAYALNPVGAIDPLGLMVWRPPRPPKPRPHRPSPPEDGNPPEDGDGGGGQDLCGKDITVQLIFAMERVRTAWRNWNWRKKLNQCYCIISQYSTAWGIVA